MLSTFIKLPAVNKTFVVSISERPFYTGFNVLLDFVIKTTYILIGKYIHFPYKTKALDLTAQVCMLIVVVIETTKRQKLIRAP